MQARSGLELLSYLIVQGGCGISSRRTNKDAGLRAALLSLTSISCDGFALLVGLLLAGIEALLHI